MTRNPAGPLAMRLPAAALSALVTLSGCGLAAVEDAIEEAHGVAREAAAERESVSGSGYVTVRRVDLPYVGLAPVEEDRRGTLPERFLTDDAVTLPLAGAENEAVLAARIEAATGLAVRIVGTAPASGGAAFRAPDGLSPTGAFWTGPLDRLLDAWTQAAGHEWRFDAEAGRIEVVRSLTVVFRVNALAGTERHGTASSTQDQAGEEGSTSLSAQSIESETEYDPWPEIEAQLAGLVGDETTVTVSPASASVTVSGRPEDVRKGAGLPRLAQPRGAAPGHAIGTPLCGALRARDRSRVGPFRVRAPGLIGRRRRGGGHGVGGQALGRRETRWRRRCGR